MSIENIEDSNTDLPWIPSSIAYFTNTTDPKLNVQDILFQLGLAHQENNGLHKNDNLIAALNNYLQYAQNELNYSRSTPQAIATMLQNMGMSRAAALQAAAGVQPQAGAIQPSAPASNSQLFDLLNGVSSVAGAATGIGNLYAAISALPFDNRVKKATADILDTQNTTLNEQKQGMALAASAMQAVSNLGFDFEGHNATSIMDYMKGIPELATHVSAINSNPYAFASLSQLCSDEYGVAAQSFSPDIAAARARQDRAAAALSENDVDNIDVNNSLLFNQHFRDSIATALYQAVEVAKANNALIGYEVDTARLQNILDNIKTFNAADLAIIRVQLQRAQLETRPAMREKMYEALFNSTQFQAAQALYGYSLTNEFQMMFNNEQTYHKDELNIAAKKYLYGIDLGGYQHSVNSRGWITAGATAFSAVTATILAGFKLFGPKAPPISPAMYTGWTADFSKQYNPTGLQWNY